MLATDVDVKGTYGRKDEYESFKTLWVHNTHDIGCV